MSYDPNAESSNVGVQTLTPEVATLNTEVSTLNTEVGTANSEISTLNTEVGTNTSNISTNASSIGTLNTEVGTINSEIGTINSEITALQSGSIVTADNSSLQLISNVMSVKPGGITEAMKAPMSTGSSVGAGGFAISAPLTSSSFGATATVALTTTGRPVHIQLMTVPGNYGLIRMFSSYPGAGVIVQINKDSSFLSASTYSFDIPGISPSSSTYIDLLPSSVSAFDTPSAGSHTYSVLFLYNGPSGSTIAIQNVQLIAYEI